MNRRLPSTRLAALIAMAVHAHPAPRSGHQPTPAPSAADELPLPFRDSEKIRAAAEKRARRAAKRNRA